MATRKEFPIQHWQRIRREWLGDEYVDELFTVREVLADVTAIPLNRAPDIEGIDRETDYLIDPPGNDAKAWEWTTDLDAGELADWDAMLARIYGGGDGSMPSQATIDGLVSTMKSYRDSAPGTPTDAQQDAAIRAVIDYIRYMERRMDKALPDVPDPTP